MRSFEPATLMRIFVDEEDRYHRRPLFMAIVEELRRNEISGASVLKGIEGYGCHSQVHAARAFDLSWNLPILIEVVESEEKIKSILPRLREMIPEGLITLESISMKRIKKR
jgi:uncharacterized protein